MLSPPRERPRPSRSTRAGGAGFLSFDPAPCVALGLRRGVIALQHRQERRRHWRAQRDDLDLDLQEIALIMLDAELEGDTPTSTRTHAAAAVSADYILLLDELSEAPMGSDLTGLRRRVIGIRARLSSEKAGGRT